MTSGLPTPATTGRVFIDELEVTGRAAERARQLVALHGCIACGVLPIARAHLCADGVAPAPWAPTGVAIDQGGNS